MKWAEIIISVLLSGIAATIINILYHKRQQNLQMKIKLLDDVFGLRHHITGKKQGDKGEFAKAMNRIPIIFSNNPEVIKAYNSLHDSLNKEELNGTQKNEKFIFLLKLMCEDAKINTVNWKDIDYLKVFS